MSILVWNRVERNVKSRNFSNWARNDLSYRNDHWYYQKFQLGILNILARKWGYSPNINKINNHFGVNFWLILTEYTFQVNYNIVSTFFYIWAPTAKVIWPRKFNPKTEKCLPDSRLELTSVWYSFSSVGGITQTCPLSVVIAWNTHSFTCLRSTKLGLLFAA